jgi:hypothetical protein
MLGCGRLEGVEIEAEVAVVEDEPAGVVVKLVGSGSDEGVEAGSKVDVTTVRVEILVSGDS